MSPENVEIATRFYEAVSRGDFGRVWEIADPDLEWESSPNLPDAGVYRGREQIEAFLGEQMETVWGGVPELDIEHVFDCGNEVLLFIRLRGQGFRSGVGLDVRIAQLATVSGGKVVRVKVYPDREEALEAVGLRE
jgi:ketosteroid isomerase-like protein